ncbi:protein-glutamine gamma-glutamyltransferase E isoform X2 [Microcaecilia unicolor]|uniref:protein-glutamine gamma-glutamyltransferase n=1 Tax=Microcaecilia unicolor TaxID=1415580 RepID=A0A6P7YVJ5_9AMPH|nr:protein-glutamine gamma-glutamyltransferase E-like isoform X2 [Microcaecilia unicolor]
MADLQVTKIDFQLALNKTAHHTNLYCCEKLIVRRAQSFNIILSFNRELQSQECIEFTVETGPTPSESYKTKAVFPLSSSESTSSWSASHEASDSEDMSVTISSPADAVVGYYNLSLQVIPECEDQTTSSKLGEFILLFNPWSSGDDVYLADEDQKQEYVMRDTGIYFLGHENNIMNATWNYDQFESDVLDICFTILDKSINHARDPVADHAKRNNPLYVSRVVTAMVNSKDDNGVLVENWNGEYADGIDPKEWSGSAAILQKWYNEGYAPVKYGQCWIFAGLVCTVLRCLGIPVRIISTFNAAQDKDGNLTIDVYYDISGKRENVNEEGIWNVHIWNEAWFNRRDLGSSYNGWQAMDATPLKQSEGIYCCGPSSVAAIKEGDVDLAYDTAFMFAKVNADYAVWIKNEDGTKKRVYNDAKEIGKFISTKAVGSDDREDITETYKYKEGSEKEREVFKKATSKLYSGNAMTELHKAIAKLRERSSVKPSRGPQLSGEFKLEKSPLAGQDIDLIFVLKNLTSENMDVEVHFNASSTLYNGRRINGIWKDSKSVALEPEEEKEIAVKITNEEYEKHLHNDTMIGITAVCEAKKTDERILVEMDILLETPSISIKAPKAAVINKDVPIEIIITNDPSEQLNNCWLSVEGSGLIEETITVELPPLTPTERARVQFDITPFKSGTGHLLATFTYDYFSVRASHSIEVKAV